MSTKPERVTIRGVRYRQIDGFSVTSKAGGVFGTRIFVKHLSTALLIKRCIQAERWNEIDELLRKERTP